LAPKVPPHRIKSSDPPWPLGGTRIRAERDERKRPKKSNSLRFLPSPSAEADFARVNLVLQFHSNAVWSSGRTRTGSKEWWVKISLMGGPKRLSRSTGLGAGDSDTVPHS